MKWLTIACASVLAVGVITVTVYSHRASASPRISTPRMIHHHSSLPLGTQHPVHHYPQVPTTHNPGGSEMLIARLSEVPNCDGFIDAAEWADAYVYDISDTTGQSDGVSDPVGTVQLWLKHDDQGIYFAVRNHADATLDDGDQMGLYCDDSHDGCFPPYGGPTSEGNNWVISGTPLSRWRWIQDNQTCTPAAHVCAGDVFGVYVDWTSDCVGVGIGPTGVVDYEVMIPFGTADEYLDITIPPDSLGFFIFCMDWASGNINSEWPSQYRWSTFQEPCYYGRLVGVNQPIPPQDLNCTSTPTWIRLNWSNPVEYDSIKIYRGQGGLEPLPLIVLPNAPISYYDTSCCCTGNYDYHLTGFLYDLESESSSTCWVYKLGAVQYIWDFNESPQDWIPMQEPNSWEWGPASTPHTPGEPTCPDSGIGDPVLLTNYWGTVVGDLPSQSCCRLVSPSVELDSCALLEICHWYDVEPTIEAGNLKVSTDQGVNWELIAPCEDYPYSVNSSACYKVEGMPCYSGSSVGWHLDYFDLAALGYAGQSVQIALDFGSVESSRPGWYIKWGKIYHRGPVIEGMFLRGDANNDTDLTMADAVYILQVLYVPGTLPPSCRDALDVNDDGTLTMPDAIYLLRWLYVPESPKPSSPCCVFPDSCGLDPTPDALGCVSHSCSGNK